MVPVMRLLTLAVLVVGVRVGRPENTASTAAPPLPSAREQKPPGCTQTDHGDGCTVQTDVEGCTRTEALLNCSGSGLPTFPHSVPPEVTSLDLSNNELTSLEQMPPMVGLKTLNLHHNKLSWFGGSPFHHRFPLLRELNVSDNLLTSFPPHLPEMLVTLDVGRNALTSVNHLPLLNLEELYVNHNHIAGPLSVCDAGLTRCHAGLVKLDLSHNHIVELADGGFSGLSELQLLSLSGNSLQQLNKYSFTGLKSLVFLDLSRNELSLLEEDVFKALTTLKFLYLRGNRLTVIPASLPLLEWLDVSHNALVTVNETLRSTLYPIELVNLAHNPLRCDCHLLWLKEWYDRREYILDYSDSIDPEDYVPECGSPPALAGEAWADLADEVFTCDKQSVQGYDEGDGDEGVGEDLGLDPDSVHGENPKYIQAYDLHVQVRSVQASDVTIEWRAPPHYTNLVIQYYRAQAEVETMLFSQVQASQGHFVLRHLEPRSTYVICLMPKTDTLSLSAPLDDCIQVRTPRGDSGDEPRSIFSALLTFRIDHTLESKFRLILGCFIVSVVVVAAGLLVAEGVLRLCPGTEKDHDD